MTSDLETRSDRAKKDADRDVTTLRILGMFFLVLGGLVLFATLWTLDDRRGALVNATSGALIVGVGLVMQYLVRRWQRRID